MTIQCTECGAYLEGLCLGSLYRCECGMYYTVQFVSGNSTRPTNYLYAGTHRPGNENKRTPVPRAFYAAFGDEG
jgi:hypothetical protein